VSDKLYWHFAKDDGRLGYGDGREIKVGETLRVEGDLVMCDHGLHASESIVDALSYASGSLICRVKLGGEFVDGGDKVVAQERTVVWMLDGTRVLHEFALWCAEEALKLVDEPDPRCVQALEVKRRWLEGKATDEELAAATAAARAAATAADRAAATAAAWSPDRAAAWAAATAAATAADRAADTAYWDAATAYWNTSTAKEKQTAKLEEMVMTAKEDRTWIV
jgi:hypothetical protein